MKVVELAHLITKYNLEEKGYCLYYHTNYIGVYGTTSRGIFIKFPLDFVIENPIACDCKIKNMIKSIKKNTIKHKINEIEKDFENE